MRAAIVVLLYGTGSARADDTDPLTEPLPTESYIQLAPSYTVGTGAAELEAKAIAVYRGLVWPDLAADRTSSAFRIEVPLDRTGGDVGLGKLTFSAVSAVTWGGNAIGAGFTFDWPTATNPAFGDDRLQVGPAVFAQLVEIPHLELSVLAHEVAAVSGTFAHRWSTRIEPNATLKLPSHVFLTSDADITFAGLGNDLNVPVNLLLGRELGEHFVVSGGPEIEVIGPDRGDVTLKLKLDYRGFGK